MSVVGDLNPTLADIAKRLDPDGTIADIVELLAETNEVLADMTFVEGNLPTGHRTTVRTGLPDATWRMLNYGVQPSKSTTKQVDDTCGMLEAYAEIDKKLADLNNNTATYRLSEDRSFLEAMNKEMADTLFFGDTTKYPERFLGLAPRFSTLTLASAASAENVVNGGASSGTSNSSIWLVGWGQNSVHGIYPKGSKAGFQHKDLGEVTLTDAAGGRYQGYRTHYQWDIGLCVRDWRYVVRICNIPKTIGTTNLIDLMVEASELLPSLNGVRPAFYMNRTMRTNLRKQLANKSNVHLSMSEAAGKHVVSFDEIPVRRCDALGFTEGVIA